MKKMIIMGVLLVASSSLVARTLHVYNFTNESQVVKVDVAAAKDPTEQVSPINVKVGPHDLSVFACNNARKIEVRGALGNKTIEGWSGCKSKQLFITPKIGPNPSGMTTQIGINVERR